MSSLHGLGPYSHNPSPVLMRTKQEILDPRSLMWYSKDLDIVFTARFGCLEDFVHNSRILLPGIEVLQTQSFDVFAV